MLIEQNLKLDYQDVLIRPKRSMLPSRQDVDLYREYEFLNSKQRWFGLPLCAANMDTTGSMAMAKSMASQRMLTALHKHYSVHQLQYFFCHNPDIWSRVFYSMGASRGDVNKLDDTYLAISREIGTEHQGLAKVFPLLLNIDVANGYTKYFHDFIKSIREVYPHSVIMAGNVATPEMVQQLLECGADIVKIGIGPGSACTTRLVAGCGYPQLSAVIECADAAHGMGGHVCADGGCKNPGDVAKAFGGGADFVMLGGLLAGTEECAGEWITETEFIEDKPESRKTTSITVWNGITEKGESKYTSTPTGKTITRKYLKFYGMSSEEAMHKHNGGVAHYRASEGKSIKVPYKGPVLDTMQTITGGLRSACTYVGASRLKDLPKCCTFVRTSKQANDMFD